jgi:hypothetical protein
MEGMKNNYFYWMVWVLSVAFVMLLAVVGYLFYRHQTAKTILSPLQSQQTVFDPLNATYAIDGTSVTLANGIFEQPAAPGSAETVTTKVFGQPTTGDINGDGKTDVAVILVHDGAGSGTFYYAAAAINNGNGVASGTNAIFLGDRIAPDTMQIANGIITVNYADRAAGEPMSTAPSVGVSKYLIVMNSASSASSGVILYDVPIAEAYPLASGIIWGDMHAATTTIPSGTLEGIAITSQPIKNITDLSASSLSFENYYKKKLTTAGWTVDNAIAAGGPGADVTGYKKGSDYIILQYTSTFKNDGGGVAPESCPCDMTFSIFAGTLLSQGQ